MLPSVERRSIGGSGGGWAAVGDGVVQTFNALAPTTMTNTQSSAEDQFPPPRLPEAEQLASLTQGMQEVRSILRRETFGVVLPIKQLEALDRIIARHEESVAILRRRSSETQGGKVNLLDALILLNSLIGQVGAGADWLEVARSCPRLPRFGESGPLLSKQKSELRRGGVLAFIERYNREALQLIRVLKEVGDTQPLTDPLAVELLLGGYEVELTVLKAQALVAATSSVASAVDAPTFVMEGLLNSLHPIIRWPRFVELSPALKSSALTAIASLAHDLGHSDIARTALEKALDCTATDTDTDTTLQSLRYVIALTNNPARVIELTEQLAASSADGTVGAPFSRDRLGRLSVFRDIFPHLISNADEGTEDGQMLIRAALAAHYRWTYGIVPSADGVVHVVTDWKGQGRAIWRHNGELEVRRFSVPLETVMRVFQVSERRAGSAAALRAASTVLDNSVTPILEEILEDTKHRFVSGIGLTGVLPLLATSVHGAPLGTTGRIVHLHPLYGKVESPDLAGRSPDLLVVDLCFGADSSAVQVAFQLAGGLLHTTARIITFDSSSQGGGLDRSELLDALKVSRWPIYFGHALAPPHLVAATGLVLGDGQFLGLEELAALELTHVDGFILIGCASGRHSPILGGVSVAHAAALAGAKEVVFSSWPLKASQASRFTSALLRGYGAGALTSQTMADYFRVEPFSVGLFGLMRP